MTVIVGQAPTQESFSMHESFFCARSEFFRRCMTGPWAERDLRLIKLPSDDPKTFSTYVNLVYTNLVATNASTDKKTTAAIADEVHELVKLYVLAEKLCNKAAKNATIGALLATLKETPSDEPKSNPGIHAVCCM